MSPHLSPDAKAIVRAAEAMTEQVRRIADALAPKERCGAGSSAPNASGNERCSLHAGHDGRHADGTLTWPRDLATGARQDSYALAPQPDPEDDQPALAVLREQIADAIGSTNLPAWPRSYRLEAADAVLKVILPTTQLLSELQRSADEDVKRLIALYNRWASAGPPPLGTSVSRWWDERLAELHAAILPPAGECTCTGTNAGLNACTNCPKPWPDIPGANRIRPTTDQTEGN